MNTLNNIPESVNKLINSTKQTKLNAVYKVNYIKGYPSKDLASAIKQILLKK
jgi:hypothetical protein